MKTVEVVFDIPVDKTFDYLPGKFLPVISPGVRVRVPFGAQRKTGLVISVRENEAPGDYREILGVYDEYPVVTEELFATADFMAGKYFSSFGKAVFSIIGSLPLKYKSCGILPENKPETPCMKEENFFMKYLVFSNADEKYHAYEKIVFSVRNGSVLLLFPEVAQAESFYERISTHHPERTVLFHGGLKNKEKAKSWLKMLNGENIIAVGTRLAVFSPMRDIKAVIVDNGHNSSYREQQTPKYDAAETAEFRCERLRIPLITGEECLSVREYFDSVNGRASVEHVCGGDMPAVYIQAVTKNTADKNVPFLSRNTVSIIEETILEGGKVAVVHNRKGSSKILKCEKCGGFFPCVLCGSGMILSEDGKNILCRFCKTTAPFDKKCPSCGGRKVGTRLYGIEKMFRMLKEQYPEVRVSKFTADTGVSEEEFDIIVGTGIIRKLLGKQRFSLIVFVSGESFLNTPDYRSEENFFIMVNEMRAYSMNRDCRIVIQTRNQNMEIYKSLRENSAEIFHAKELSIRKQLGYPPVSEIIKVELKGRKKDVLRHRQETLEGYFKEKGIDVIFSGQSFPPVKKGDKVWKYLFRAGGGFDRAEFRKTSRETGFTVESNPEFI